MVTRRHFMEKAIAASLGFSSVWGVFASKEAEAKARALHKTAHGTKKSALKNTKTAHHQQASSVAPVHARTNRRTSPVAKHVTKSSTKLAHAPAHSSKNLSHPALIGQAAKPLPVVMLDPGHGGKDPGAIGITGIYEKHVAEATARVLYRLLRDSKRYRVVLTRYSDYFVPLNGRVELAHRHKADLFMSIHADALHDSITRGASVYTRAHGASDTQTALLAEKENSADRFSKPHSRHILPKVAAVLGRLEREETQHHSTFLASQIVSSFEGKVRLLHNPTRHAAFAVLKSADIPSVLVEMGFMSNRLDEAALRRPAHRHDVAQALKIAIDQYFVHHHVAMG